MRLAGKVALITGGTSGMGRATALLFAREGAQVSITGRNQERGREVVDEIRKLGGQASFTLCDVRFSAQCRKAIDETLRVFGKIDVLFNNAGVYYPNTALECSEEEWDLTLDVNLRAYFLVAKAFLPSMKTHSGGSIVNVTSTSAEQGFLAEIAYCPSKYAIEGLTQCMALELRPYNIAANSLNVSSVEGKQLKPTGLTLEEAERLPESVKGRYVDYDDLANAYADAWAFLALQRGNGVTGQRFRTKDLAAMLRSEGQESVLQKFKGKLTKATYVPIDFPKVARYQTPGGGFKEIIYD